MSAASERLEPEALTVIPGHLKSLTYDSKAGEMAIRLSTAISLKRIADGGGMGGEPAPAQVRFKRRSVETAVNLFDPPKDEFSRGAYVEPKTLVWAISLHFEVKDGEPQQEVERRINLAIRMMETGR